MFTNLCRYTDRTNLSKSFVSERPQHSVMNLIDKENWNSQQLKISETSNKPAIDKGESEKSLREPEFKYMTKKRRDVYEK